MIYDVGNAGPGLGQAHKCCSVKPVNGIHLNNINTMFRDFFKIYIKQLFFFNNNQIKSNKNQIKFALSKGPLLGNMISNKNPLKGEKSCMIDM